LDCRESSELGFEVLRACQETNLHLELRYDPRFMFDDWITESETEPFWSFNSNHHDLPVLLLNPHVGPLLQQYMPEGRDKVHLICRSLFRPTPYIKNKLLQLLRPAFTQHRTHWIGCHVRSEAPHLFQVGLHPADFVQAVHALMGANNWLPEDTALVLAADSVVTIEQITRAFRGSQVIVVAEGFLNPQVEDPLSRSGAFAVQAITELFALAHCDAILATPLSTFSFMAAAIGNVIPLVLSPDGKRSYGFVAEPCVWNLHYIVQTLHTRAPQALTQFQRHTQCTNPSARFWDAIIA